MFDLFGMIREKGVKIISKELLNEVLEEEVLSVRPYISDDPFYKNVIMWEYRKNTYDTINIYELAHKCKEWAKSKDYYISSGYDDTNIPVSLINHNHGENSYCCDEYFEANTEPESIFKACQWILIIKRTNYPL